LFLVESANPADPFNGVLIVEMARERVAGIGRQRDNAAIIDDLHRLVDQARLRIVRMNSKELRHDQMT